MKKCIYLFSLLCLLSAGSVRPMDKNFEGNTPLSLNAAAEKGDLSVVEYLVENGAKVDERDEFDRIVLCCAAVEGHLGVVRYLVENGAKVDERDKSGYTALHFAAFGGHLEVVKFLALMGAKVDEKDEIGGTALHQATAFKSHLEIFKFLVLMGAKLDEKNSFGETPLYLLAKRNKEKLKLFNQWWKKNRGWLKVPKKLKLEYFKKHKSLEFKDFRRWKVCIKDFNYRLKYVVDTRIWQV